MVNIKLKQYENFRKCFNKNLIEPLLGKNYYNMGSDVYMADQLTTEDLKNKYDMIRSNVKLYKTLFTISLIINGLLVLFKL